MTSKVYVALRVKATPERTFEAFVEEIGAWWRPNMLFQTTPRPGVLSFEPGEGGRLIETRAGGKVFEIGTIRVWEPPLRLVFSWRQANFPPDLHTEVEVGFEAVGDETRVSVEHRGFDQVPAESAARHHFPDQYLLMRLADFWRGQIAAVGERVA
jgi:uncharacterized protein YndB with AHSA1/START domain